MRELHGVGRAALPSPPFRFCGAESARSPEPCCMPRHCLPAHMESKAHAQAGAPPRQTRQRRRAVWATILEAAPLAVGVAPHRQVVSQHRQLGGAVRVQIIHRDLQVQVGPGRCGPTPGILAMARAAQTAAAGQFTLIHWQIVAQNVHTHQGVPRPSPGELLAFHRRRWLHVHSSDFQAARRLGRWRRHLGSYQQPARGMRWGTGLHAGEIHDCLRLSIDRGSTAAAGCRRSLDDGSERRGVWRFTSCSGSPKHSPVRGAIERLEGGGRGRALAGMC